MTIAAQVRSESFLAIQPKMNRQEAQIYDFLRHHGRATAWTISEGTGQLITSTRRGCHDLMMKRRIRECGRELCQRTGVSVTVFEVQPEFEFDESGQASFA